jgi:uncharacterized protein
MSDAKPPREPSTEEIIASISRLIAEDGGVREPVLGPLPKTDDILDLTERLDDDRVRPVVVDLPADDAGPVGASREVTARTDRQPPSGGEPSRADPDRDRLLSGAAAEAATSAFARLGVLTSERRAAGELSVGGAGRTVEDMVLDALRPLLRAWLDAHLPSIVERLVREEIARVTGAAGLR